MGNGCLQIGSRSNRFQIRSGFVLPAFKPYSLETVNLRRAFEDKPLVSFSFSDLFSQKPSTVVLPHYAD